MVEKINPPDLEPSQGEVTLETLLSKYKNINDIPDNELEAIGFIKAGDGHLVKKEFHQERITKTEQLKLAKLEYQPFDEIFFEAEETKTGRRLDHKDFEYIERHLQLIENLFTASKAEEIVEDIFGNKSPMGILFESLSHTRFKQKFGASDDEWEWFLRRVLSGNVFSIIQYADDQINEAVPYNIQTKLRDKYAGEYDYDIILPSKAAEEIFISLERVKGVLLDVQNNNYTKAFEESMADNFREEIRENPLETDGTKKISEELERLGLNSLYEVSSELFAMVLENEGLNVEAQILREAKSYSDVVNNLETNIPPSLEEKELKGRLAKAPKEEKRQLSQRFKELKEIREKKEKLLSGVVEYYSSPAFVKDYVKRQLTSVENRIMRKSDEGAVAFKLDANFDANIDKDPGLISGDCTEGVPLPFDRPEIPVFNVKIYTSENNHIGNIYLLATNELKGGELASSPVWHLDAIQIPSSLDWEKAIKNLFESLRQAAEKKNIVAITVNKTPETISNYDYISEAVLGYCKVVNAKLGSIEIPRKPSGDYSQFQSDGEVFFIPVS